MFHGWQHLTAADREEILRGIEDGCAYGGPYHLELDWVDNCNARCFFCNSAHHHEGGSIPWPRAERLLEEAAAGGLRSVRLSGGGEPTLHPNFPDLLTLLGRRGIVLDNLNTNGTLLSERVREALASVRIGELRISLNYSAPGAYADGMGLPARMFERTVEMIRGLGEVRRRAPEFQTLALQFFVTRATARSIRQSYELARELGADLILFRELVDVDAAHYFTPQDLPELEAQLREVIREDWRRGAVVSHLESHGIGARVAAIYQELAAELGPRGDGNATGREFVNYPIRYCYIGWHSMTLVGSQAAYPCCYLLPDATIPSLGNLATQSLGEIWRGEAYQRFRKEMRDYFLLQRRLPFFARRTRQIAVGCATHDACPITRSMCDEAFYEEAERRLERLRRRLGTRLWSLAERAGRVFERTILRRPNY